MNHVFAEKTTLTDFIFDERKKTQGRLPEYRNTDTIKIRFCGDRDHKISPLKGHGLFTMKTKESQ